MLGIMPPSNLPALAEATGIVLPDTGLEMQSRTGRVVLVPIACALYGRGIPDTRKVLQMAEERFEEAHAMAKADDVRVQDHAEIEPSLVLGIKLQQTVGTRCSHMWSAISWPARAAATTA